MARTVKKTGRARPKKERAEMAAVRGSWTFFFTALGYVVTYLAEMTNALSLGGLQIPLALAIGGLAYAAKKFWWPDTKW